MSRAFKRESDDAGADEIAPVRPPQFKGAKNYITREGADRLRQRVNELVEERRGLIAGRTEADANAKAALRRIESAIRKLQSTLDSVIIAERPTDQTKAAFGASVRVRDEHGEEDAYQIVGVDEADPGQGRINSHSPLARALLNRKAGEKVSFQSPAGLQELTILDLHY